MSENMGIAGVLVHCAPFCCIQEALALRRVSRVMREVVNRAPWHDLRTLIEVDLAVAGLQGSVGLKLDVQRQPRHASFFVTDTREGEVTDQGSPAAIESTRRRYLSSLTALRTMALEPAGVADPIFAFLTGLRTLHMVDCSQSTVSDNAFSSLTGLHVLNMSRCHQSTITDRAFSHLSGLHSLDISGCRQSTITDEAFAHLSNLHTLKMAGSPRLQTGLLRICRGFGRWTCLRACNRASRTRRLCTYQAWRP